MPHKKEPIKTIGTNMQKYLKENAYSISNSQKVEVNYLDGKKNITLVFSLSKDSIKIHKEIQIPGYPNEISTTFVDKNEFLEKYPKEIEEQEKKAILEYEKSLQQASETPSNSAQKKKKTVLKKTKRKKSA
jgi:hypothetical protein